MEAAFSNWNLQSMALDGEPAKHLHSEGLMVSYKGKEVRTERYPFWKKFLEVPNFRDFFIELDLSIKDKQDLKDLLKDWIERIEMEWLQIPTKRGFQPKRKNMFKWDELEGAI